MNDMQLYAARKVPIWEETKILKINMQKSALEWG